MLCTVTFVIHNCIGGNSYLYFRYLSVSMYYDPFNSGLATISCGTLSESFSILEKSAVLCNTAVSVSSSFITFPVSFLFVLVTWNFTLCEIFDTSPFSLLPIFIRLAVKRILLGYKRVIFVSCSPNPLIQLSSNRDSVKRNQKAWFNSHWSNGKIPIDFSGNWIRSKISILMFWWLYFFYSLLWESPEHKSTDIEISCFLEIAMCSSSTPRAGDKSPTVEVFYFLNEEKFNSQMQSFIPF